ncbi:MAG TPA: aminotransferase class V-fold PLP-dependent enzyme [Bryobacteraceae bacterium]|nr:aminotransferase class V-fold PLP-dependent enzyme [Bryobacteraceae bacterium]
MPDKLALPSEDFRAMAAAAVDFLAAYFDGLRTMPVVVPTTSRAIRERIDEPLPLHGADFMVLMDTVRDVFSQYSRHSAHPRMFGYVASPGTAVTAVSHMLAAAMNINVTAWRSAPSAADLERLTIDWLKQMLGYPPEAGGLLLSGGSMANFAGLAVARTAKAGAEVVREGVAAARRRMCVYVSAESHYSVAKAAGMLGLGEANVREVKTDDSLHMDLADLERLVDAGRAAGHLPLCVVANAGTTATGAFDPLSEVADFARRNDLWMHVDAAYGGFAALAPSARHLFAGIEQADSIALDPHKWLYAPVGCGCVLYKDPAAARAAFAHGADYTRTIGLKDDEAFAFWDYGPELTRPFRALDLWMLIKFVGTERLGQAIEENIACAKYFAELVKRSDDFEMLAPVELSVFCFRHVPKGFSGDLDAYNEKLLVKVQCAGSTYLSNARVGGKFALRGCVLNYRTTKEDMAQVLEDVREAASSL